MTKPLIDQAVDRFLGWKVPEDFRPDGGISFKPTFNDHLPVPMKHNPMGTNLLDAIQAKAMLEYVAAPLLGRIAGLETEIHGSREHAALMDAENRALALKCWRLENPE